MNNLFVKDDSIIDSYSLAFRTATRLGDIPKSDELTGIELRLSRVFIKDNLTPKVYPFPGLGQMYLVIIVLSDDPNQPVQNLDLKGFAKVDDNEELPVDRTIFYWKKSTAESKNPGQIHVFVSVIKSKEKLREVGEILVKVQGDQNFNSIVSNIKGLLAKSNPFGQIADSIFSLASIVGKYLGKVSDKPLLTWVQSFTDINGDLDKLGKFVMEKENANADLALTLIVRDSNRENKAAEQQSVDIQEALVLEKE